MPAGFLPPEKPRVYDPVAFQNALSGLDGFSPCDQQRLAEELRPNSRALEAISDAPDAFRNLTPERAAVLRGGIVLAAHPALKQRPFSFGALGRVVDKGIDIKPQVQDLFVDELIEREETALAFTLSYAGLCVALNLRLPEKLMPELLISLTSGDRRHRQSFNWEEPEWEQKSRCKGQDIETFFPANSMPRGMGRATRFCDHCGVRGRCGAYALTIEGQRSKHRFGIWGGTNPSQRHDSLLFFPELKPWLDAHFDYAPPPDDGN